MMLRAFGYGDGSEYGLWMINGGRETIKSFPEFKIEEKYLNFCNSLKMIVELPDFYLAHAGIRSHDAMNSPEVRLLWDRDCVIDIEATEGRRLICGHTVTALDDIVDSIWADKVVIDNGCVFNHNSKYGNLVALRLDDMKLFVQPNIDI